jgi:hypothetical protein
LVEGWNSFAPTNMGTMLVPAVVKITKIIAIAFVTEKAVDYTTRWRL